jgi:hypothetical protein
MSKLEDLKEHLDRDSVEKLPQGGMSVKVTEEFLENMMNSDKLGCRFKRGDTVYKATYAEGDVHSINTPGIIKGSIYEETLGEAYLVLFQGDENMCFTNGAKLKSEI